MRILLRYEAGEPTAAACANYSGKTSVLFPTATLWTLYNFPKARLMYMSATWLQAPTCFSTSICDFDGASLDSASPGVTSLSISLSGGLYGQSTARSECTEQKGKTAIGPALRDVAIFVLLILDHLVRRLVSLARLAGKCSLRTAPTF